MADEKVPDITTETESSTNSTYSKSTTTVEDKKGSTTITASKLVTQSEDGSDVISTTVSEKTDGKKIKTSKTTNTIDTYSTSFGHSRKETAYANEEQKDSKGRVRFQRKEDIRENDSQASAFEIAHGYTDNHHSSHFQTNEQEIDKNGHVRKEKIHASSYSRGYSSQRDELVVSNKREEIKRNMYASSENARVTVAETRGKRNFIATVDEKGVAQYSESKKTSKGYKVQEVYVSADGRVSGTTYTIEMREGIKEEMKAGLENAKKKVMSVRAASRVYTRLQKKADRIVDNVSTTAHTVAEYQQQTANPSSSRSMPVNLIFEPRNEATEAAIKEAKEKMASEQSHAISENKALTTEQIVQQKLNQR